MIVQNHHIEPLSVQAFAALSKFALKLRKRIGVLKVADILSDHRRACELFTQATLSGDDELISLVKQANSELNIEKNLIKALGTYIKYVKSQGKSNHYVDSNKYLLKELSKLLYGIQLDGAAYRRAANQLLAKVGKKDQVFCLQLIRNFYPHWINANDVLVEENNGLGTGSPREALIRLWRSIDDAFITTLEGCQLSRYSEAIKQINVLNDEVKFRTKIAKVIIINQRRYAKTQEGYRSNVDELQGYFTNARLIDYFLSVSREVYRIWFDSSVS